MNVRNDAHNCFLSEKDGIYFSVILSLFLVILDCFLCRGCVVSDGTCFGDIPAYLTVISHLFESVYFSLLPINRVQFIA